MAQDVMGSSMRLGLIADIHANREGLEAVLADLEAQSIDRLVILGDIVGIGPDPDWCLETVEHLAREGALCLRGNHDRTTPAMQLSPVVRRIVDWTVNRLTARQRRFLEELPLQITEGDMLFSHASAAEPEAWHAIDSPAAAAACLAASPARLVFCGHMHAAALYREESAGVVRQAEVTLEPHLLDPAQRWLAVIGSAGQPRDGSLMASWSVYDTAAQSLCFRQVAFDAATTRRKVRAAGVPEAYARHMPFGA
jgi:predicted phosphodiesterase